jgi:hypothetical protein
MQRRSISFDNTLLLFSHPKDYVVDVDSSHLGSLSSAETHLIETALNLRITFIHMNILSITLSFHNPQPYLPIESPRASVPRRFPKSCGGRKKQSK